MRIEKRSQHQRYLAHSLNYNARGSFANKNENCRWNQRNLSRLDVHIGPVYDVWVIISTYNCTNRYRLNIIPKNTSLYNPWVLFSSILPQVLGVCVSNTGNSTDFTEKIITIFESYKLKNLDCNYCDYRLYVIFIRLFAKLNHLVFATEKVKFIEFIVLNRTVSLYWHKK